MVTRVKRTYRRLVYLRDLFRREIRNRDRLDLPLLERAKMWWRGFLAESVALYGVSPADCHLYLSDYQYHLKTTFINYGPYNCVLNDKVLFYQVMKSISAPTPSVHGFVDRGRVAWLDPPPGIGPKAGLSDLLLLTRDIVLKPSRGGGGRGISFLSYDGGGLTVNGEEHDLDSVDKLLAPDMIICERVHQGSYADRIYSGSTNTMRIVTMWDPVRDEPFIAAAAHRFGRDCSAPVDNFGQGGFSAPVDLETGEFGAAVSRSVSSLREGRLKRHAHHPDTCQRIEGMAVPRWADVKAEILRVATSLPHLVYVGWDVVVLDDGLNIIEGNSYPNPDVLQVHKPLLADARVRDFYRHHGVLSG